MNAFPADSNSDEQRRLAYIAGELEILFTRNMYRSSPIIESHKGVYIETEIHNFLHFAGNDYLALAEDPRLADAAIEAIQQWGTSASASQSVSGRLAVHTELEDAIATFEGTHSAVILPSGFSANLAAITTIARKGDLIIADRLNHASLVDASLLARARLVAYRHNDIAHARELLLSRDKNQRAFLVTDSVFSADGDIAPLADLVKLRDEFPDVLLMVDEAHGTGVLGRRGTGGLEECGVHGKADVVVGTMSKALGSVGGFVASSHTVIQATHNYARPLIYTTSPAPSASAAALEALNIIKNEPSRRARVLHLTKQLNSMLDDANIPHSGGRVPIITIPMKNADIAMAVHSKLKEQNLFVPVLRPPTVPANGVRLRVSLCYAHKQEHLNKLVASLAKISDSF